MDPIITIKNSLGKKLAKQVEQLSESDLKKIENGTHVLSVRLVKKKSSRSGNEALSVVKKNEILKQLQNCNSREEGSIVLSEELRNKKELEQFAKFLDVLVLKQDKVDQLVDKIVEATVGAILRSNAIRGKNRLTQGSSAS